MSPRRRKRLDPSAFQLPAERLKAGEFSDRGTALAASVLRAAKKSPRVLMQVTAKQSGWVAGIDEVIAILKSGVDDWNALTVCALYEGDRLDAWDTVLTIEGDYTTFAHLESVYLGVLAHRTLVCSNIREIVDIARTKQVFFFGARDEHFLMQPGDGFAATVGGARQVCTLAQASLGGSATLAAATLHHSLIAAFGGDIETAARHLAKQVPDDVRLIALVDYDNDVANAAVDVAKALGDRLWGVRLDTSENMVDKSLLTQLGTFRPTGVNPQLVWNVRNALDAEGFGDVRIAVSGGFDAERVQAFEDEGVPVDAYGIGSAAYRGCCDFTADIVQVGGKHQARAGRALRPNPKLERVK